MILAVFISASAATGTQDTTASEAFEATSLVKETQDLAIGLRALEEATSRETIVGKFSNTLVA